MAEQDSLNASLLGPDAGPGTPEFDLFIREVATEMTKAGQKCTAIRRAMAPVAVSGCRRTSSASGWRRPRSATRAQRIRAWVPRQPQPARRRPGEDRTARSGRCPHRPAIPMRIRRSRAALSCRDPAPHGRSMGHRCRARLRAVRAGLHDHALQGHGGRDCARNRGRGSLALSLFTHSPEAARDFVQGAAAYYGRMLVIDRTNAANRRATVLPFRSWSTAGRPQAAARKWAGCAA